MKLQLIKFSLVTGLILSIVFTNDSIGQDLFPKLNQITSLQRDTSTFYFKEIWMKSKDINYNDPEGYFRRASGKAEMGYFKEALVDINKAIGADSTIGEAYSLKGYILYRMDSIKPALSYFNKSLDKNNKSNKALDKTNNNLVNFYYCGEINARLWNFDEAEKYFKKAISIDKKFPEAYFGLANLMCMKYTFPDAERLYKKAIELNPTFALAYFNMALMFLSRDQNNAMKYLNKTIEIDPKFGRAYYVRGYLERYQNHISSTYDDWNKAIELEPKVTLYHTSLGFLYIIDKNYKAGFNEVMKVITGIGLKNFFSYFDITEREKIINDFISQAITFSKHSAVLTSDEKDKIISALCCFFLEKFRDAEDIYLTLVINNSAPGLVFYLRGFNFEYLHKADQSIESYNASLRQKSYPSESYLRKGIVLNIQGNYPEAVKNLKYYLGTNDSTRLAHRSLASCYISSVKYDSAIYEFNKLIRSDSSESDIYYYRGICHKKLEHYGEAISDFNHIITINPYHVESICNVAECKYSLGDTIGAYNDLNRAYDTLHFLSKDGFFLLGSINLSYKKYDQAITNFNAVIQNNPDHLDSYIFRGLCYYCKGDYKHAKADFSSALRIDNNDITALYTRGLVNIKQGNFKEAYADLTRADALGHPLSKRAMLLYLKDYKP